MTNVWYVKNTLANCDGNLYLPILHLPRVELHCKLQEKFASCDRAFNLFRKQTVHAALTHVSARTFKLQIKLELQFD